MFHSVQLCRIHNRFVVGAGNADVKGGDDSSAYWIFTGYIDTRDQFYMVDGEACDFFHKKEPPLFG